MFVARLVGGGCRRLFTQPFPTHSSRPLRTALLHACLQLHVFLLLAAAHLLAPLVSSRLAHFASPLVFFRIASLSLLAAAAHSTAHGRSPSFLLSSVVHPSISHSLICLARSLFKEALLACSVRSFIRALCSQLLSPLSLSLRSAHEEHYSVVNHQID